MVAHPHAFDSRVITALHIPKKAFVTAITVVPRPFLENVRVYYACMGKGMNNGHEEVERAVKAKQQTLSP